MPMNPTPQTCSATSPTITAAEMDRAAKAYTTLRQNLAVLQTSARPLTIEQVSLQYDLGQIGDDPGVGHPCRNLWAYAMLGWIDAQERIAALQVCYGQHPKPPGPPEVASPTPGTVTR